MEKLKHLLLPMTLIVVCLTLTSCENEDTRLYDWDVNTSMYYKGQLQWEESFIEYSKTQEYMKIQKAEYESCSTSHTRYIYLYSKRTKNSK